MLICLINSKTNILLLILLYNSLLKLIHQWNYSPFHLLLTFCKLTYSSHSSLCTLYKIQQRFENICMYLIIHIYYIRKTLNKQVCLNTLHTVSYMRGIKNNKQTISASLYVCDQFFAFTKRSGTGEYINWFLRHACNTVLFLFTAYPSIDLLR